MKPENEQSVDQEFEFGGIFNLTQEDFEEKKPEGVGFNQDFYQDFYAPRLDLDTVKNKTYNARGRFVPNAHSVKERLDKVTKHSYYLPDPDNIGKKYYCDAPCNIYGAKDIATNAYMMYVYEKSKIYDSEVPVQIKSNCRELKRNTYHYSLFQIMTDVQQPDLVGTVKILRFGKAINEKIEQLIKGNPDLKRKSVIPYDPFNGKDFFLTITEGINQQGNAIADYEKSFFDDGITAMSLDGGETRVEQTQEGMKKIFEFLKENSPMLDQCVFKPLTEAEEDKLIRTVKMLINDDYYFNKVYKYTYGKDYQPSVTTETITNAANYAATASEQTQQTISKPQEVTATTEDKKAVETTVEDNAGQQTSTTNKFKSLKAEAEADKPAVQETAKETTTTVEDTQSNSVANMGGGDMESLMGGALDAIDDIQ